MLVRLSFILGALSIPVSILLNKEASGIIAALFFMFLGAYFTKPRFKGKRQ